jgi:hypothetical protein
MPRTADWLSALLGADDPFGELGGGSWEAAPYGNAFSGYNFAEPQPAAYTPQPTYSNRDLGSAGSSWASQGASYAPQPTYSNRALGSAGSGWATQGASYAPPMQMAPQGYAAPGQGGGGGLPPVMGDQRGGGGGQTRGGIFAQILPAQGSIIGAPDHDGSNTDWFAPQGTSVKAPVGGTIMRSGQGVMDQPGVVFRGDDGRMWELRHVRGTAQPGMRVQPGQDIAVIGDPSLPGSYQHVDIRANGQGMTPFLRQNGAQARTQPTSGPSHGGNWMANGPLQGQGGGGMGGFGGMPGMPGGFGPGGSPFGPGMGMPGMGMGGPMGMMGMMGGIGGGMPGMGMGMPPMGGMGMGGGMPGMGGMGMPPMMGMGGGMPGMGMPPGMGGGGFPGLPPMMGGMGGFAGMLGGMMGRGFGR